MKDIFENLSLNQRITQRQKDSNDKQWYKDMIDRLDDQSIYNSSSFSFTNVTRYAKNKANYDLFNNIIDIKDLEYVCKPFGEGGGELPANFANRDIVSPKIKVLLGMEMGMPFAWRLNAINEEATTRKEQKEAEMIREYVINEVMSPIKLQIQQQLEAQNKGRKLTPDEQAQLQEQMQEETTKRTPDEVRKYMVREHQDPAEQLGQQILQYLLQKEKIKDKFNKVFKHMTLSGTEVGYVGAYNGHPVMWPVNSLNFECSNSPDIDYIEDEEWATCTYALSPSQAVTLFGKELGNDDIDRLYDRNHGAASVADADFNFLDEPNANTYNIRAKHMVWKSLCKVGFLTYKDRAGKPQLMLVDENYKISKENGDIKIEWEWIPETHEGWKLLDDIYVYCRPIPGQHRDLDDLYTCKLPYYGASIDNMNSPITSPMDRMKYYQYLHDIIVYRMELLMASDDGKAFAVNIKAIPKSAGIDIKKFLYYLKANKIAFLNPNEEGNRGGGDVTNMVKEIDMSLASDIKKYMDLAEYIDVKCGTSIGVTKQMEAQIGADESVGNTRQNLVQASHIIKPYFELHNTVKGNILQALIDRAKYEYSRPDAPDTLSYVLDDMSIRMLKIDKMLLESSKYGLFMANAGKSEDAKQAVVQLAQSAMQNQQADLLDVIKIIRADSIVEAEELLEAGRGRKNDEIMMSEKLKQKAQKEAQELERAHEKEVWVHEADMIKLKELERRKTELQKSAVVALGFEEDKDTNDNNIPDVLEVAKLNLDNTTKTRKLDQEDRKLDLQEDKLAHEKEYDEKDLKIKQKQANKKPAS